MSGPTRQNLRTRDASRVWRSPARWWPARWWPARLGLAGFLLVAGGMAVAAPLCPHPWDGVLWVLVQTVAVVTVISGVRRHGLTHSLPWRLLTVAVIAAWAMSLTWATSPYVYGAALAVQYGAAVSALLLLSVGPDGAWRTGLLDAGVITLGLGIPYWTLVIDPLIDRSALPFGVLAITLVLPLFDVFMLCLVLHMALIRTWAPWLGLIVAGQLLQVLGDSFSLLNMAAQRPSDPLSDIFWLGWSVLVAAAVLHPSIAVEAARGPGAYRRGSKGRPRAGEVPAGEVPAATVETGRAVIPAFLALALLSPVLAVMGRLLLHTDLINRSYEAVMLALATAMLSALLVLRLHGVTRLAERRAAALDRQALQLAGQAVELNALLGRQRALQRQLAHRAHHDTLTGLPNRSVLNEVLAREVAARTAPPPALLMFDLDGFKDINDTYGHPVGDDLLIEVARRLAGLVPKGAIPVRLGGDEFAVLLPGTTGAEAARVARRVLEALRTPFRHGRRELHLTGSIGLLAETPVTEPSSALRDADLALYAAKNAGKNRIVRYDSGLRQARLEHARLVASLHDALAHDGFGLHFQPVVDLHTGRIRAVEALLRWTPPGQDPVSPARFIPVAEETGMIVPLGAWALDRACAYAARRFAGYGIACSVNISGRQLCEEDFGEVVLRTLRRYDLPPEALILEITESMLVTEATGDTERITDMLSGLRRQGVRIALDDFGTGYSSLSYLRILPVDILKIDQSFVAALRGKGCGRTIAFTKAIMDLASSLDLEVIAEGVETAEQAALLASMGCVLAQGHYFARPASDLPIEWLRESAIAQGDSVPDGRGHREGLTSG